MSIDSEVIDTATTENDTRQRQVKEVKNLWKIYERSKNECPVVSKTGNITVVLGPSLSGKSALINLILDNLVVDYIDNAETGEDYDEFLIKRIKSNYGPEITENRSSDETRSHKTPDEELTLVELPSIDNDASLQEVIENCLKARELSSADSIRVLFAFPFDMMKNNTFPLLKMLSKLNDINCEPCLVVTKRDKGDIKAMFEKLLREGFSLAEEKNTEVVRKAKEIIKKVLEAELFFDFFEPKKNIDWDREKLLETIKKVKGLESSNNLNNNLLITLNDKIYTAGKNLLKQKNENKILISEENKNLFLSAMSSLDEAAKFLKMGYLRQKDLLNHSCVNFIDAINQESQNNMEKSKFYFDELIISDRSRCDMVNLNSAFASDNSISTILNEHRYDPELTGKFYEFVEDYILMKKLQDINKDFQLFDNVRTQNDKMFCVYILNFITFAKKPEIGKGEEAKEKKGWLDYWKSRLIGWVPSPIKNGWRTIKSAFSEAENV